MLCCRAPQPIAPAQPVHAHLHPQALLPLLQWLRPRLHPHSISMLHPLVHGLLRTRRLVCPQPPPSPVSPLFHPGPRGPFLRLIHSQLQVVVVDQMHTPVTCWSGTHHHPHWMPPSLIDAHPCHLQPSNQPHAKPDDRQSRCLSLPASTYESPLSLCLRLCLATRPRPHGPARTTLPCFQSLMHTLDETVHHHSHHHHLGDTDPFLLSASPRPSLAGCFLQPGHSQREHTQAPRQTHRGMQETNSNPHDSRRLARSNDVAYSPSAVSSSPVPRPSTLHTKRQIRWAVF